MNDKNSENKRTPLSEKAYLESRKQYDDAELEVSGRYDTWILTLAGGALGLSITFLEKIAPHPQLDTLCWLKWSWATLITSLLAGLTSLVTSQSAIRENRKELDIANDEQRSPRLFFPRWFTWLTNILNWASLVLFVIGATLLCVFSFKNIDLATQTQGVTHVQGQTNTTAATTNGGIRSTQATMTGIVAGVRVATSAQNTSVSTTQETSKVDTQALGGAP